MLILLPVLYVAVFVGWTVSLFLVARTFSSNWKQFDDGAYDKLSDARAGDGAGSGTQPEAPGEQCVQRGVAWRVTIRRSCKTLFLQPQAILSLNLNTQRSRGLLTAAASASAAAAAAAVMAATAISAKLKINNKHVARVEENKKER